MVDYVVPGMIDSSAGALSNRNKIINGAMVIDQRNAGASVTPASGSDYYSVDRWAQFLSQTSKYSIQQSTTAPSGFTNSVLVTSLSAYTSTSSDVFAFVQWIEGFNVADLGWGTTGAQTITISFWVRSSLTGTFGGAISNSAVNRSYPFTFTINAANTFEYKTITVAGDTTGTWVKNNGIGLRLWFNLGTGSTYLGTAGAWASADYRGATGETNLLATNGATFYITGVQLEKGTSATAFEYRNYQQELAMCQRYWFQSETISFFYYAGSGQMHSQIEFPVKMRTVPTVTYYPTVADMYARTNAGYITKDGTGNVAASQVNSGIDTDACYYGSQGANCRVARTANAEL